MKDYIIKSELGILCRSRGVFTDKEGNKRNVMIYWSDFDDNLKKAMKMFFITAWLQYILIKSFASDIKGVKIIKVQRHFNELKGGSKLD